MPVTARRWKMAGPSECRDRHAAGLCGDALRASAGRRRRPPAARPDAGGLSVPPRAYRHHAGTLDGGRCLPADARRAVRYLLAIDRVEAKKQQLRLTKDQLDQLRERKRTEQAAAESCFRELYTAAWLPRVQDGELDIEKVERGGRPLQATGVQERIMELLTCVSEGIFAYANGGSPALGSDGKFQVNRDKVILGNPLADDEIDLDSGFLMIPAAVPAIANLADNSDGARVMIHIEALSTSGFDPSWLRNALDEPLDEADIERIPEE